MGARRLLKSVGAVWLVAVALWVTACASSSPAPLPGTAPAESRAPWYLDCWRHYNSKQFDLFGQCYADQATSSVVDSARPDAVGRSAILQSARAQVATLSDRAGEVSLVLAHGPHLVSLMVFHGTHRATHKPFGLPAAHMAELDASGNATIRDWFYLDEGTLAGQLGLGATPVRGVSKPAGMAPVVVIARHNEEEGQNVETVRALVAAVNARDVEGMRQRSAADYRLVEVARPADMNLTEATAAAQELFAAFGDAAISLEDVWGVGTYVVATGTLEGTNTGDWPSMGVSQTGRRIRVRFLEVLKVERGRVTRDWLFYNGAAIASQLAGR